MKEKIGIIGLGIISKYHEAGFDSISDIAEITGICDIDLVRAKEKAALYGAIAYSDYNDLINNKEIRIVDIILPHHLHYPVCKAALLAGKHVIIEKPFVTESQEGEELIKLAKRMGCILSVAENTPFVEAYIQLKKIIPELGKIYSVKTMIAGTEIYRMVNKNNWKGKNSDSGGGVIMDAAPHSFYLLNWLFGEISELVAYAGKVIPDCEVEDNALITGMIEDRIFFESSFSFTAQTPWTERLEVYGENGTIIIDQIRNPSSIYFRGAHDYDPQPIFTIPYDPANWKGESIARGIASFIKAVHNGQYPVVDPEDALNSIRLCENSYESVKNESIIRL
jgi:UDP-N-acetyl-2-amino-2-deoxyglucuronate dehydrogenase